MNCSTNHITLKRQLEAMARVSGSLMGLPIVAVASDSHTDNAMTCDKNHLTFEDLLKSCIGVDVTGKPALRVKFINSEDVHVNCTNNVDADPLKQMFAYDSEARTYALVINQSEEA